MTAPLKNSCGSLHSAYGPHHNVRADYAHLPLQIFWTWVTGKGMPLSVSELKRAMRPLPGGWVLLHLIGSWAAIVLALWTGYCGIQSDDGLLMKVAATLICWLVIVNRGRCLQATFHFMSHGSAMPHKIFAPWAARVAFTAPFLYVDWGDYVATHVNEHHHVRVLCTELDPDQRFIRANGFHPGMPEASFWLRVWFRPFAPDYILARFCDALSASMVKATHVHRNYCLCFWGLVIGVCANSGLLLAFVWLYALPAFVLLNHSLWLQLLTEHLWFASSDAIQNQANRYGRLTWGRFQGRSPPCGGLLRWIGWWARLFMCDIPVRLYVYPQDLPNHDFHHRMPLAPYHRIANIRATHEDQAGRFGPLMEVWGFMASLRVIRNHLCRGDQQPFLYFFSHSNN